MTIAELRAVSELLSRVPMSAAEQLFVVDVMNREMDIIEKQSGVENPTPDQQKQPQEPSS